MTRIWLDWIGISSPRLDHWKTFLIEVVFFYFILFIVCIFFKY